jgi:hypothetical protein
MMFLDCPAYLDDDGTVRCGLPAEVRRRLTMHSTGGPLESAIIRCPSGHWFNGPIEFLTCESKQEHEPAMPGQLLRLQAASHDNAPDPAPGRRSYHAPHNRPGSAPGPARRPDP